MSLASSRVSLTHRCTVERDANIGSDDGWGNPNPPDWQAHLSDLPCRVWATTGREAIEDHTTVTPIEDVRLIIPSGSDVTEEDRIASVTFRGAEVQPGPLAVRAILRRTDHLELVLAKVS